MDRGKLIKELFNKLYSNGFTISVAESCTGGLICSMITDVPGSSRYFMGGVISYSNESKMEVLGVDREFIIKYGAVSEEVASRMAEGVRRIMRADIGISTTGIAGPDGGTPEKPVGLCYIGISVVDKTEVGRFVFEGNRLQIKESASLKVLEKLLQALP